MAAAGRSGLHFPATPRDTLGWEKSGVFVTRAQPLSACFSGTGVCGGGDRARSVSVQSDPDMSSPEKCSLCHRFVAS